MYVVVYGDIANGIYQIVGPFSSQDEASLWTDRSKNLDYVIMLVTPLGE